MSGIALIGLDGIFPGAGDAVSFWHNIVDGVDAISEVPEARWEAEFHDPSSTAVDRFYCRRGGFIDDHARFDPLAFGIMPKAVDAAEPDQLLLLRIGVAALADAGYDAARLPRERTGVIVGRGNYAGAGLLRLEQHVRTVPQVLRTLRDLMPWLDDAVLAEAESRLRAQLTPYGGDVAAGLIPNLLASRLANRLDLRGPAYTVDAACASALIAVEQACDALRSKRCDLMLAGAAHLTHDLTFWATFCQLGALSRSGGIRPLSADADGILAGEGLGMVVLKRVEDARADGDRIYAVIDGCGSASDGRAGSVVSPAVVGQLAALERAWSQTALPRDALSLLEAHGTGTPAGDAAELETVARFFGPPGAGGDGVIGSVKSMIGHTMPASGMASLIKTVLAVYHGVLPPTLHCDTPHPRLAQTRFRTLARAEPWTQSRGDRVAAVNTFGFGGINAHVILRGEPEAATAAKVALPPVLRLAAIDSQSLLARLDAGAPFGDIGHGPCRLAIVEPDARKLATARKAVIAGKPWNGRQQVWFSPRGLLQDRGRLAFVFPGVDSRFEPRCEQIESTFKLPLPAHCTAQDPAGNLSRVVVGLLGFNRYLYQCLTSLGLTPDAVAGHSVGEWSAMICGGMLDAALSERTNAALDFDAVAFPDVLFLAAACDATRLQAALTDLADIAVSHDNCPHQAIACGRRASIETVATRLREGGIMASVLPFVSGFHSPLFADHMSWYRTFFDEADLADPAIPVWSATTARPFPDDVTARRALALDHLLQPVRFRALIEALYADGIRVFVEVGTGSLAGFISDTLGARPHTVLRSNRPDREGLSQLQQLSAALWVEGAAFDSRLMPAPHAAAAPGHETSSAGGAASRGRLLKLGVPLLRVDRPLTAPTKSNAAALPADDADPVRTLVRQTLADIQCAGEDVLRAWQQHAETSTPTTPTPGPVHALQRRVTRLLDLARTIPFVADHALYPQREGWPVIADRHPVVPMTMEVMLVREAVAAALPGRKVVEVSHIEAFNWLAVSRRLEIEITLDGIDDHTVAAEITGYFRAHVHVADDWPEVDHPPVPPLSAPRATTVSAAALYRDGWMFHGPAYQGVEAFHGIGDNGIDGRLRVPDGQGALLDNMGQLAGYWVMEQPENCLAMPIGVDRIRFYAPDPQPGDVLEAQVRMHALDTLNCVSDHQLRDASGRLRIAIDGWRTRRYQMDKPFWVASRRLSHLNVARTLPGGVTLFQDRYDTAILRDYLSRRYLTAAERAVYETLAPKRRRQWLAGRVAAKDAVRAYLRERLGVAAVFPQELRIDNDAHGAPHIVPNVTTTVPSSLHVSIAHKGTLAAAIVAEVPVGIDIETVAPREPGFVDLAFTPAERTRLAAVGDDVAWTRGWVAKEVAAKRAGSGLRGRPQAFEITAVDGDCLRVGDHWVVTHAVGDAILGWSVVDAAVATSIPDFPN